MKQRCYAENCKRYEDWGGRGISVCEEWRNNPGIFIDWCLSNGWERGLAIDRKENDGDYEPDNCRFTTSAINNRNKRSTKLNWDKVNIIRNTKEIPQKELAKIYSVSVSMISNIINNKAWL